MTDMLVLEFTAPQAGEIYRSVNRLLGLDDSSDLGDWPAHCSATSQESRVTS